MIMNTDPNIAYKKMLEYEEYLAKQYDNAVDLGEIVDSPNDTVRLFANALYSKDSRYLSTDRCVMLLDEGTTAEDLFCIMTELVLYGLDHFSHSLFDITSTSDDLIYQIRPYLRSVGIVLTVDEVFDCDNINMYRDRSDYYCNIGSQPPPFIDNSTDPWDILTYRMTLNRRFVVTPETALSDMCAYFVTKTRQLFTISFGLDLS